MQHWSDQHSRQVAFSQDTFTPMSLPTSAPAAAATAAAAVAAAAVGSSLLDAEDANFTEVNRRLINKEGLPVFEPVPLTLQVVLEAASWSSINLNT
jgi:hypothetical protein